MLVIWPNERNTRIYTETGGKKETYQLRGYQHISRVWGRRNAYQRIKRGMINLVLTAAMWACICQ